MAGMAGRDSQLDYCADLVWLVKEQLRASEPKQCEPQVWWVHEGRKCDCYPERQPRWIGEYGA